MKRFRNLLTKISLTANDVNQSPLTRNFFYECSKPPVKSLGLKSIVPGA